MIHHRSAQEVRNYDLFKLVILIILILLLLLFWQQGQQAGQPSAAAPTAATAAQAQSEPAAQATPSPLSPTAAPPAAAAPSLDAPTEGAALTAGEVAFSGTGEPGGTVEILDNGVVIGQAVVGADGKWSWKYPLGPGSHAISVRPAGKPELAAAPVNITTAAAAAAPSLDAPTEGAALTAGEVAFSGTGEPGGTVEILDNGVVIGQAVVGADGKWSWKYPLGPGSHAVSVRPAGKPELASAPVNITTAAAAAAAPSLDAPTEGAALTAGEVAFSGTGEPGGTVEILDNGVVIGQAVVGADGKWSWKYPLGPGSHAVSVRPAGKPELASTPVNITAQSAAPAPVAAKCGSGKLTPQGWVVAGCDTLTKIAKAVGVSLQALLKANPNITNPNVIFPGQIIKIPGK
jgi:LysM repeat protein